MEQQQQICKVEYNEAKRSSDIITTAATEQIGEGEPELGGHGVVQQRIDGAVCIDGKPARQQEPAILVASPGERVVHDVRPVRQPQRRKGRHDDNQHLYDLSINQSPASAAVICNDRRPEQGAALPPAL